jgi:hypothetical protein
VDGVVVVVVVLRRGPASTAEYVHAPGLILSAEVVTTAG